MDTTTCQVCGQEIKAGNGFIAHHGYKRPWQSGWQTASCKGARCAPYEVSCERLREVVEMFKSFVASQEEALTAFLNNPPQTIRVFERQGSYGKEKEVTYNKTDDFTQDSYRKSIPRTYECVYDNRKHDHEQTIKMAKADLFIMERRLREWRS